MRKLSNQTTTKKGVKMKKLLMLLVVVVTLFGCGVTANKVNNIESEVSSYFRSDDFKEFVAKECLKYYDRHGNDKNDSFLNILKQINNSDLVLNYEKNLVEAKGLDYDEFVKKWEEIDSENELDGNRTNNYSMLVYEALGEVYSNPEKFIPKTN